MSHLCGVKRILSQHKTTPEMDSKSEKSKSSSKEDFKIKGDWKAQSKELKKQHSELTDSDLKYEEGKENEMLKRVESRLGKNRDEVIGMINKGQSAKA